MDSWTSSRLCWRKLPTSNPTTTETQEPLLSPTTLASCPVSVKDFDRSFLVEAKKNCLTEPGQLNSEPGVLQGGVDTLQYTVDVLTRYLLLPVAYMVGELTLFPEAHYVWPKVFGAETGPLSLQIADLADESVSTREYAELKIFKTKFCACCLRLGHVAKDINNELTKNAYSYSMMSASAERFGNDVPHGMAHRMEQDSGLQFGSRYDYGCHPMGQDGMSQGYNEEMERPQKYVGHDVVPVGHNQSFAGRSGGGHSSGMARPERS